MDSPANLRTEADYRAALQRVKIVLQAQPGEPEFDELNTTIAVGIAGYFYGRLFLAKTGVT